MHRAAHRDSTTCICFIGLPSSRSARPASFANVSWTPGWIGVHGVRMDAHWMNDELPPAMPQAAILLGDMNSAPDTAAYAEMVGPMDMEGRRILTLDRFVDCWTWLGNEENGSTTPHKEDRQIDHIWVTADLHDRVETMYIDYNAKGSDHKPVWMELSES